MARPRSKRKMKTTDSIDFCYDAKAECGTDSGRGCSETDMDAEVSIFSHIALSELDKAGTC